MAVLALPCPNARWRHPARQASSASKHCPTAGPRSPTQRATQPPSPPKPLRHAPRPYRHRSCLRFNGPWMLGSCRCKLPPCRHMNRHVVPFVGQRRLPTGPLHAAGWRARPRGRTHPAVDGKRSGSCAPVRRRRRRRWFGPGRFPTATRLALLRGQAAHASNSATGALAAGVRRGAASVQVSAVKKNGGWAVASAATAVAAGRRRRGVVYRPLQAAPHRCYRRPIFFDGGAGAPLRHPPVCVGDHRGECLGGGATRPIGRPDANLCCGKGRPTTNAPKATAETTTDAYVHERCKRFPEREACGMRGRCCAAR